MGEKRTFLGRQKFLAGYVAEDPKIWPNETFWPNWPPSVAVFNLNQKQKSYGALKSGNSKFWKNRLPPPPFEMKQPLRNPFTWHQRKSFPITPPPPLIFREAKKIFRSASIWDLFFSIGNFELPPNHPPPPSILEKISEGGGGGGGGDWKRFPLMLTNTVILKYSKNLSFP